MRRGAGREASDSPSCCSVFSDDAEIFVLHVAVDGRLRMLAVVLLAWLKVK